MPDYQWAKDYFEAVGKHLFKLCGLSEDMSNLRQTVGGAKSKQRKTTDAKRARDWMRIEPLFKRGDDIQQIAIDLKIDRDTVSAVIAWAMDNGKI